MTASFINRRDDCAEALFTMSFEETVRSGADDFESHSHLFRVNQHFLRSLFVIHFPISFISVSQSECCMG